MPVQIVRWRCQHRACAPRTVQGVGNPEALQVLGWYAEAIGDGHHVILCPQHHPRGAQLAAVQAQKLAAVASLAHGVDELIGLGSVAVRRIRGWTERDDEGPPRSAPDGAP